MLLVIYPSLYSRQHLKVSESDAWSATKDYMDLLRIKPLHGTKILLGSVGILLGSTRGLVLNVSYVRIIYIVVYCTIVMRTMFRDVASVLLVLTAFHTLNLAS